MYLPICGLVYISCNIFTLLPPNLPIASSAILDKFSAPSTKGAPCLKVVFTEGSIGNKPGNETSLPTLALANPSTSFKNLISDINLF